MSSRSISSLMIANLLDLGAGIFAAEWARRRMMSRLGLGTQPCLESIGARDVAAGAVHGDFPEQLVLREQELGLDVEDFSPLGHDDDSWNDNKNRSTMALVWYVDDGCSGNELWIKKATSGQCLVAGLELEVGIVTANPIASELEVIDVSMVGNDRCNDKHKYGGAGQITE
ncbi:hypothetical protein F0562_010636 [Nyssa sinensis]|uniref:Uncharacterized protein n=1 Tax=Nyssa sinensis TaxID=561372 RepID=A0A5J5A170_9ASTE|nr:hypothetical protein F0562_010636 [Nyssa sinensis]